MSAAMRVLLVDDDEDDALLTTAILREIYPSACDVRWAPTPDEARRLIADQEFDISLVDYRLGAVNGIDLIREAVNGGHEGPFILLTGVDAREVDVDAMGAGASDYLVKGQLSAATLERSIRYAVDGSRARAALRDSERRLREVSENVHEVFWVCECATRRLSYVNPVFEEVFGRPPDALFRDPTAWLEYVHPADRASVAQTFAALAAGDDVDREFRVIWPDGSERWVRGRGFPVRGARGGIARLVGTAEDVTPRRRAEDGQHFLATAGKIIAGSLDLQDTCERIARLMVPAFADSCVIDVFDDSGELKRRAHAFADPDKEQAVLEMRRRFPLHTRPSHPIWQVVATAKSFFLAKVDPEMVTQIAQDPEELALARRALPASCMFVPLSAPRPLGAILLSTDPGRRRFDEQDLALAEEVARRAAAAIENARLYRESQIAREREQAHASRLNIFSRVSAALAEAEPKLPGLLSVIGQAVTAQMADLCVLWVHDPERRQISAAHHRDPNVQPIAQELLGVPEMADVGLYDRLFPEGTWFSDPQVDVDRYRAWLPAAHVRYLEMRPVRTVVVVPLRARGLVIGAMGVAREGTGTPYSSEEAMLLQEIGDRAALTLENARLLAKAETAARSRDEIIAIVSHDVANPLNTITLAASLLLTRAESDASARPVRLILRSAERAGRIMRDLLDSSAVDTGRLEVVTEPQVAVRLVRDVCESFELQARDASVTLKRAGDQTLKVHADRQRVMQVLGNLIGNALKFTEAGGEIAVTTQRDGEEVRISVRDTGPGISERDLPHVFDRYFQGEIAAHRGVGLGLAISKSIVTAHGGRIWVESRLGAGSVFTFTLHLAGTVSEDGSTTPESGPGLAVPNSEHPVARSPLEGERRQDS